MSSEDILFVFDIDGTLTDSVSAHQNAFKAALRQLGVELFNDRFHTFKHHTDSFIASEIYSVSTGTEMSVDLMSKFEKELMTSLIEEPILEIPGATRLIKDLLSSRKHNLCFATGSLKEPALYKLKMIGIEVDPRLVVSSNDIHDRETIVSKAISQAELFYNVPSFKKIVSVGDGIWDLITAQNLGIDFIGVGEKNKTALVQSGMHRHCVDFSHVGANTLVIA